jgi:hydroxymethylbilane synthase
MNPSPSLTFGTRTSALALWQTNYVMDRLRAAWPGLLCQIQPFSTQGDRTQAQNKPLPEIGGKGLFTQELEEALLRGTIDLAIHSLKDLPVADAPGLTVGAIPSREDVRDALVARNGWTLATLPPGAVVGTSSTRRTAQLLAARPDLTIKPIRGNVDTRIRKVQNGEYDATLLAAAGLRRLGLSEAVSEWLPLSTMLPAPGQGALAIQCRAEDADVLRLLAAIEDPLVRLAVTAERRFLQALGGGCSAPVAAYAQPVVAGQTRLHLDALVASTDGRTLVRVTGEGAGAALGAALAETALAQGAGLLVQPVYTLCSSPQLPLAGKRIVLTRPAEQASPLCEQLTAQGAQPILAPVIRIVPKPPLPALSTALADLPHYRWVIFTSANAVQIFADQLTASHRPHDLLQSALVAAVGPSTAEALRTLGVEPAFVPADHRAEAIVPGLGLLQGQRVLLPQASAARPALAEALKARGAQVDAVAIYDTLPAPLSTETCHELHQGFDAILFTSGSTVRNFMAATQTHPALLAQLHQATVVCIGPVTAQSACEAGLTVQLIAEAATSEALIEALLRHYQTPTASIPTNGRDHP